MKNALKDIFLMGVGVASLTKKKAERAVRVFSNKGVITKMQANKIVGRMLREAAKVKARLEREGRKEISMVKMGVVGKAKAGGQRVAKKARNLSRKVIRAGLKL